LALIINTIISEKFTHEEVKKRVGKEEKEIRETVLLLANGMIDVNRFKREKAFEKTFSLQENGLPMGLI